VRVPEERERERERERDRGRHGAEPSGRAGGQERGGGREAREPERREPERRVCGDERARDAEAGERLPGPPPLPRAAPSARLPTRAALPAVRVSHTWAEPTAALAAPKVRAQAAQLLSLLPPPPARAAAGLPGAPAGGAALEGGVVGRLGAPLPGEPGSQRSWLWGGSLDPRAVAPPSGPLYRGPHRTEDIIALSRDRTVRDVSGRPKLTGVRASRATEDFEWAY
jgi:hypothetical protein